LGSQPKIAVDEFVDVVTMPVILFENPYRRAVLGQWIRTWNGIVFHHGIVSGFWLNPATNTWSVVVTHTIQHYGVVATSLEEFCQGRPIEILTEPSSPEHQKMVLATAEVNIGRPYNLFSANCEHFASHCYTHKSESPQLRGHVLALSLIASAALLFNTSRA
jgi:hypothetical protein